MPAQPNVYRSKKDAQDAHEAIRPTDPGMHPNKIRRYLSDEQYKLYKLMWQRFVASQMVPAIYDVTTVEIDAKNKKTYNFRVSGSVLKFDGYLKIYETDEDDEEDLPEIPEGARLTAGDAGASIGHRGAGASGESGTRAEEIQRRSGQDRSAE